jgi:ubiquinone/menaquinone biosynthesis C-methylase UbiE
MDQVDIDKRNIAFWDELCGSQLAINLGISDSSADSLKKFDDFYLDYYPYLLRHVPVEQFIGKRVLEVGLGYGTLGGTIASCCAYYMGLDIALGPVEMMNYRLQLNRFRGLAIQGSMLECPFNDNSIDAVVSIGCFHHTGSVEKCINETWRVLKPGGRCYFMVYNKFAYRQWMQWPKETWQALLYEYGLIKKGHPVLESQRFAYDKDSHGKSAPETTFCSIRELKRYMQKFNNLTFVKENCDSIVWRGKILVSRDRMLPIIGNRFGLDVYISGTKPTL